MKRLSKRLLACVTAVALMVLTLPPASGLTLIDKQYDSEGRLISATFGVVNGGEDFDRDRLTWGTVPGWKVDLINSAALDPRTTGYEELDKLVAERLSNVLAPGMSNFDMLRAIYDDLVQNAAYALPIYKNSDLGHRNPPRTYLMSYKDCIYATYLLQNNAGVCDEFSAAFVAMANAVGFEAYDMSGWISGNGHAWSLIRLGDRYYIFDAQAEQVNIKNNHVSYMNFMNDTAYAPAYRMAEGAFATQWSYRTKGYSDADVFVAGADHASRLQNELDTYARSRGMSADPNLNGLRLGLKEERLISYYESEAVFLATFKGYLDDIARYSDTYYLTMEPAASGNGDFFVSLYRDWA